MCSRNDDPSQNNLPKRRSIAQEVEDNLKRKEEAAKNNINLYVSDETFLRRFWDEKLNLPKNLVSVIVDRNHYCFHVDKDGEIAQASGGFAGFSGRRFDIEFFDGRKAATNNLWYQGDIPTDYDESLPDNARFLKPETLPKMGWVRKDPICCGICGDDTNDHYTDSCPERVVRC